MNRPPGPDPSRWQRVRTRLLDLLYPPRCALCDAGLSHGRSLCHDCLTALPPLAEPFCQSCGEMFPGQIDGPFACPNCSELAFAFQFARPAMRRDDRTLELIHRLKYRREIHLAEALGRLALQAFADPRLASAHAALWPLVPVPLHRQRLRWRHFNQAEEIARTLAGLTGQPVLKALCRLRPTTTQTRLTRKQRMENLRGAFQITGRGRRWIEGAPQGAILIDDVLTTGSTVNECAKTLRHAGFRSVLVVTVMRG